MYGLYTLHFEDTNGQKNIVQQSNHLTRKGLKFLLKGEPKITHPGLVGAQYDSFKTHLNFMFFYVKGESTELMVKDEDIFDMEFPDLNAPNIHWTDTGIDTNSDAYSFEGKTEITIEGIGIGYKEIGGSGENDFVFSYTNLKNDPDNYQTNYFKNTDYNNRMYYAWKIKAVYDFRWAKDHLPTIKANIGGQIYKFRSENYDSVNQYGDDSRQSSELFYQNVGSTCNSANAAIRLTTFEWAVGGRSLVPASKFEELVIQDAATRELSRVFKVEYKNKRSFPVHITGFRLFIGDIGFSYKSEIDNYIILPAGKTISLTLAAEIFLGSFPTVDTDTFNTTDYLNMSAEYFRINDTKIVAYNYTTYVGTAKETTVVKTGIVPNEVYYVNYTGPTDQLTKYEFINANGTKSKPYYVLGSTTPTSYAFSAPALTSVDGWVVQGDDVVFRITAPTGVSYIEFSLSDNVWQRFEIVAGAVNFIKLPSRFLYESVRFLRWANNTQTGIITRHTSSYVSGANILPIEYVYGDNTDPYIVGYYASSEATLPIGYTNASTYVEGTTTLTPLKGGKPVRDSAEGSIALNSSSYLSQSNFVGPIPNSKWFDSVNMKLISVPKFDEVVSTSLHKLSTPGNLVQTYYQITPVKVNTLINTKLNAYPKIINTDLIKTPTVEKPTTITGYLSPVASRIELYNSNTNEIISSVDSKPCSGFTLKVTVPMYTHIPYGLRYIDAQGQNISAGQEYFIYGKTLAGPDLPTDVYYDTENKVLTFTATARAVRATVSRYGIEMYSFECSEGLLATLSSSESLDPTGNYVLTLFNSEGGKSEPYYIFGEQDDNPIKPDTTGPYNFSDWTYNSNNYTTNGNIPFMRVEDFETGLIKVTFDGALANVVGKTYNPAGILKSAIFETNGIMMEWLTGYSDYSTTLGKPSDNSYISILTGGNGYIQVVAWHEWLIYANVNLDKFGYYTYGKWVPAFGKNNSWYQFTEIQDGYIRNTVKLLMRTNTSGSSRLPFYLDSSIKVKTPNALIYIHTNDMPNSALYRNNANNQSYCYNMFYPYINNVQGTWDVTYRADGFTIDKLRCYTDEAGFIFDTAKPDEGWKLVGFDPLLVGHLDYENVSYSLEFATYSKYSYTSFIGTDKYNNNVNANADTAIRARSVYYIDQIYTRVYPYMYLKSFKEHTGTAVEKYNFSFSGVDKNNPNARWAEAAFSVNIGNMLTNTSVIINGVLATITPREVTIPYTPGNNDLLSIYQFENPASTWSENGPHEAEQTPFTYTAYDFSIPGITLSNDKHPRVLGIALDGRLNNKEVIKVTFVRNRIIQPQFPIDYSCTSNVEQNNSVYQYSPYYFPYVNIVLYPEYPRVVKNVTDTGKWEIDPSYINVTQLSSLFILKTAIYEGISNKAFDLPEDLIYRNMVKINGESFNLIINSNWIDWLDAEEKNTSYMDITFKLSNADASKEIQFKGKTRVDYVGFEANQDIEVLFSNYGEGVSKNILSAVYDIYSNINNYLPQNNTTGTNVSVGFIGYNTSVLYNYIPHVIPSGKQNLTISLRTKLYTPTVISSEFVIPDRTEEVIERFNTKFQTEAQISLNDEYIFTLIDPTNINLETFNIVTLLQENIVFECNGEVADRITMDPNDYTIVIHFDQLNIAIILKNGYMYFVDTEENTPLERDELFVFKFTTKNLPLNSNLSPFYFSNHQYNDAPIHGLQYSNLAVYNDIDGEARHQTFYIVTGQKPSPIVQIDNRISQSVYPVFGKDSYIYSASNRRSKEY